MDKNVKPRRTGQVSSKKERVNDIIPFTERPSANRMVTGENEKRNLGAAELFSQFTANIIKEDKLFTR